MKKLLILPLILIMLSGLGGCTKGCSFQLGAIENNTSHEMSASYTSLSGTKVKPVTVKEGEPITISIKIKTTKGTLDVSIVNEKGDSVFEENDVQTKDFTVNLDEPGKYTIKLKATKHKGSYSFKW